MNQQGNLLTLFLYFKGHCGTAEPPATNETIVTSQSLMAAWGCCDTVWHHRTKETIVKLQGSIELRTHVTEGPNGIKGPFCTSGPLHPVGHAPASPGKDAPLILSDKEWPQNDLLFLYPHCFKFDCSVPALVLPIDCPLFLS